MNFLRVILLVQDFHHFRRKTVAEKHAASLGIHVQAQCMTLPTYTGLKFIHQLSNKARNSLYTIKR